MSDNSETDFEAWQEDVEFLVSTLTEIFESDQSGYYIDDMNNTLYVELEGLEEFSHDEIVELAEPALSELDLDFEDVILLPLNSY